MVAGTTGHRESLVAIRCGSKVYALEELESNRWNVCAENQPLLKMVVISAFHHTRSSALKSLSFKNSLLESGQKSSCCCTLTHFACEQQHFRQAFAIQGIWFWFAVAGPDYSFAIKRINAHMWASRVAFVFLVSMALLSAFPSDCLSLANLDPAGWQSGLVIQLAFE
jgi:hypothetical protein